MNILIHAYSLKSGGGKYIIENYLHHMKLIPKVHFFVIKPPNLNAFEAVDGITFIEPSKMFDKVFNLYKYYFSYIPNIIHTNHINLIWNFGDVIIPNFKNQIYFFDWAYAVYEERYIWSNMRFKEFITRKLKVLLIKQNIKNVSKIVVQSSNMKNRLEERYNVNNVIVFPTPIKLNVNKINRNFQKNNPEKVFNFLYVATYSFHKNHKILLDVAKLILKYNIPIKIFLTIDDINGKYYINKIKQLNIEHILVNLGHLKHYEVADAYNKCDAVVIPSLLESYGIPYFEAMYFQKPILASNLDFAIDACKESALYFDPFDPNDILDKMVSITKTGFDIDKMVLNGNQIVGEIPDWDDFIKFINIEISDSLNYKIN